MANIFALLVGINNYPVKPLQGCINDVNAVAECLTTIYGKSNSLHFKRLTDDDPDKPTRNNMIASFDHFETATDGDICLFYYSGHGSFSPAPQEFWTDTSGFVQSFVCQDSRLPGGRDLVDKEMSFLIWKTMIDKPGVTFVAITDCCHCGTITKAIDDSGITERMVSGNLSVPLNPEDYLGYDFFIERDDKKLKAYHISKDELTGNKRVTVSRGNHIHLAASRDSQTSKELTIDGKKRGAFTHSFIKTLYNCGGKISYKELMDKTLILVKNIVPDQNPDININGELQPAEKEKIFLSQEVSVFNPEYLVYYDPKYKWSIKAGSMHNVSIGDRISINGLCDSEVTGSPSPDFSTIRTQPELGEIGKTYFASVERQPNQKQIKLSFAPGIDPTIKSLIQKEKDQSPSAVVQILMDGPGQYVIRSNNQSEAYITLPGTETPVFKTKKVTDNTEAVSFLNDVETVAKWLHLQEFNNPASQLSNKDYHLKLFRSTTPGDFEEVKEIKVLNDLYYTKVGAEWNNPAFKLLISNTSQQTLWISNAYLEFNYGITIDYFESKMEIRPGGEGWLLFTKNTNPTDIIYMSINNEYHQLGYNETTEYLKLFISTDKIPMDGLEQEGVELNPAKTKDMEKGTRSKSPGGNQASRPFSTKEWKTETIGFRIIMPIAETEMSTGKATRLDGISIEAHAQLKAKVSIIGSDKISRVYDYLSNSVGQNVKSLATKGIMPVNFIAPPHEANSNSFLVPFDLVSDGTTSGTPMDVLELSDVTNRDVVNADNPLIIQTAATRSADEDHIIPIGYDPETKLYYPVGYTGADGKIYIETLPEETASDAAITQKSFLGSIKIYFQKAIGQKLGFNYEYPRLAIVEVGDDLEVKYESDRAIVAKEVKAADNILLFIHGIIGDTEAMVKCIRTSLDTHGNSLRKKKNTLVLAFDYENLNTTIEQTAEKLGERLAEVGLQAGHTKNLYIIAHSMGGLVSRYFIEKTGGDKVVTHLVMLGTPNNGTPWADVRDMADTLLTYAINGSAALKPWMFLLSGIGKLASNIQVTIKQMDPKTGIYKVLNTGIAPEIPYTVIMGNTRQIIVNYDDTSNLISKLLKRVKKRGVYDALDAVLFKKANDIAVTDESISTLQTTDSWKIKPAVHEVACDHMNYFLNRESLVLIYNRLNSPPPQEGQTQQPSAPPPLPGKHA
ncbi:MAG: caspase family protein [Ferruginibacter sp.]|nr:caspase family protein [Ferruginibacter sp.]